MKYFFGLNFSVNVILILILFKTFVGAPHLIIFVGFFVWSLILLPFLPAITLLDYFSVDTCSGGLICGPTASAGLVTLVFIFAIVFLLDRINKKLVTEQSAKRTKLHMAVAISLLFNIGGAIMLGNLFHTGTF